MAPDVFDAIIAKLAAGAADAADISALRLALTTNGVSAQQLGKYNINIGQGQNVQIGDSLHFPALNDEAMQAIAHHIFQKLQPTTQPTSLPLKSVDELVQQVRSRLHDDIQRLHGTMPLWGVDHWVPLGELFVDVNILEELSSSRRSELDDLWQDFSENPSDRGLDRIGLGRERERVSGLAVLAKHTNLMVVGKPGSGKSTYLQRVVTECNAGNLQAHKIPVLLKLREFVDDGRSLSYSLERYLEQYWQLSAAETQRVLNQGRSLVLLDGLDEVTGEDGKTITRQIKQFARAYPQVQMVVTCRTQSQESRFERFGYVEVADFDEQQSLEFSSHWFKSMCSNAQEAEMKSWKFITDLTQERNQSIQELVKTPVLLSLVCVVFHYKGNLYSSRMELYTEGVELLLKQWDTSKGVVQDEIYRNLSLKRKLELLGYLAIKKFEQPQYVLFTNTEITRYISEFLNIDQRDSQAVLEVIESQHGLLIERARKVWSFLHLTLQEYFVASYLTTESTVITLEQSPKDLTDYLLNPKWRPKWREIFLFIIGNLNNADSLLIKAKEVTDLLIKEDSKLQLFLSWVYQKSGLINPPYSLSSLRASYFVFVLDLDDAIDTDSGHANTFKRAHNRIIKKFMLKRINDFDLNFFNRFSKNFNEFLTLDSYIPNILFIEAALVMNLFFLDLGYDDLPLDDLYDLDLDSYPELEKSLQDVRRRLLEDFYSCGYSFLSLDLFRRWWNKNNCNNKKIWLQELRNVIIEKCNVGHAWQLSEQQIEQLNNYYDANKFLVDCLNSSNISLEVKQEITDSLLLPFAEIEKRKHEKAG